MINMKVGMNLMNDEKLKEIEFLTLFISLRCTHKCNHCLYACSPEKGEDMSLEVFEKSIDIAKKNNITKLTFFGGEPFTNSEIFKMLDCSLKNNFDLIIATNGYLLNNDKTYEMLYEVTHTYKNKILFDIGNDKYHKQYFDPTNVADKLKNHGYPVLLQDYCDYALIISDYNKDKVNLQTISNISISCCEKGKYQSVGVLPNGAWTICPPSLIEFGNISNIDLKELLTFKHKLPFKCELGCTMCLKDFNSYNKDFRLFQKRKINEN